MGDEPPFARAAHTDSLRNSSLMQSLLQSLRLATEGEQEFYRPRAGPRSGWRRPGRWSAGSWPRRRAAGGPRTAPATPCVPQSLRGVAADAIDCSHYPLSTCGAGGRYRRASGKTALLAMGRTQLQLARAAGLALAPYDACHVRGLIGNADTLEPAVQKSAVLRSWRLAFEMVELDRMARPKDDGAKSGHQLPLDDGACAPAFWTAWNTF
jgi:hypothetical protein